MTRPGRGGFTGSIRTSVRKNHQFESVWVRLVGQGSRIQLIHSGRQARWPEVDSTPTSGWRICRPTGSGRSAGRRNSRTDIAEGGDDAAHRRSDRSRRTALGGQRPRRCTGAAGFSLARPAVRRGECARALGGDRCLVEIVATLPSTPVPSTDAGRPRTSDVAGRSVTWG